MVVDVDRKIQRRDSILFFRRNLLSISPIIVQVWFSLKTIIAEAGDESGML